VAKKGKKSKERKKLAKKLIKKAKDIWAEGIARVELVGEVTKIIFFKWVRVQDDWRKEARFCNGIAKARDRFSCRGG
jgi:hypothetical protein